ncbi:DnaD domain protein [Limosilactobacillus sp. c9Ua_26_M]|uniref:DnaD domain protein n=1 Tax=Limosilactobacillus urinaemulieris TaxID=2742600 RepID=A0ABR8ZJV4_9LACO|nr:DnaD domain protein [Limosilactobacillus urinaemulieris]MBD8085567.1 DnaD domain protein [Limosilactobacillus urinaemulieris]
MKAAWLYDEHPILIDKKLASVIGLNESIVLQQLNYWLHGKSAKQINDRLWIYNTYDNWQKDNFPFWSKSTVRRALDSCIKKGLIITGNFNKAGFDNTKWYSIDIGKLDQVMSSASVQNEQTVCSKRTDGSAQNEQANTRYYTDITPDKNDDDQPVEDAFSLAQLAGINVNSGLNLPVFTDYINRLGNKLVCYAIKRTNELASHPNWSYLKTVLKSLEDNHVKTIEQAEVLSKKYGKQRYKGSKQKTKSTPAYQLPTKDEGMTQAEALAKELAKEEEEDRKKSGDS